MPETDSDSGPAYLTVPREAFEAELSERIGLGRDLLERVQAISSADEYEAARSDFYTWDEYNRDLLRRRLTTTEIADDYALWGVAVAVDTFQERVNELHRDVQNKIRRLVSVAERVRLFDEAAMVRSAASSIRSSPERQGAAESIFIVHGRDDALKHAVHGFLRQVTELEPTVLHDQPNAGRTLIEKFEGEGGGATFAVVLLTGDDVGRLNDADDSIALERRARQNVVFELGFFVGLLGRPRVAVIYEEGVTIPSDIEGLAYIPYDERGAWRMLLARELKAAGIGVDANRML
jgi:predicted nucleotide-binding protein